MKCNFDVSFINPQEQTKAGWIVRDEYGVYRDVVQARGDRTYSILAAESQALIGAMQNMWIKGYRQMVFEGDYKILMNLLNDNTLHFGCITGSERLSIGTQSLKSANSSGFRGNQMKLLINLKECFPKIVISFIILSSLVLSLILFSVIIL